METTNNEMTAERSLEIIANTIEQSRRELTRGSWKNLMLWGVSIAVIALLVGHLWQHTSMGPAANGLWALVGLVAITERWVFKKDLQRPTTFVSKTLSQIWSSFGIMAGAIGLTFGLICGLGIPFPNPMAEHAVASQSIHIPITAIIIMSMGIAGLITGRVLNCKPITVCCFISGFLGSVFAMIYPGPLEMVTLAISCVIGLVVPAFIIKMRED